MTNTKKYISLDKLQEMGLIGKIEIRPNYDRVIYDDFKKKSLLTILNNGDVDLTDDEILTLHYKKINQKGFETKKKNGTLNTSRIEDELTEYFIQCDINFKSQYKSDLYPFACDFYLTDYDLYIEIQGTWTHGGHPFDETNKDDIDKLNMWKSKDNGYYKNAINTWSIRDVKKRKIAKENNLNIDDEELELFLLRTGTHSDLF